MPEKLVLIVIDGLTPAMLERAVESEDVPALRFLMGRGEYRRAVTTFPSLTPSASRRSRPARIQTSTRSRTSSGTTAGSSASSSTARRSAPCARRA